MEIKPSRELWGKWEQVDVNLQEKQIKQVPNFKYLGRTIKEYT